MVVFFKLLVNTMNLVLEKLEHTKLLRSYFFETQHIIGLIFRLLDGLSAELLNKKVGIIGPSNTNNLVKNILRDFCCHVLVCCENERHPVYYGEGFEYTDLNTLCSKSDVILIQNMPSQDSFGKEKIEKMKQGAVLINRGAMSLLNIEDIAEKLGSKIGGISINMTHEEKEIYSDGCEYTVAGYEDRSLEKIIRFQNSIITTQGTITLLET